MNYRSPETSYMNSEALSMANWVEGTRKESIAADRLHATSLSHDWQLPCN
jgi:hypothetical protein